MAELITGRGGTDHVDSEDFGAFNAVTLGDGTYILSGCSMAMKTASTLHIAAGELLMQGRHVRIKGAGEDIDVAVGTTGYNRNDLVALHYKQEGGIESVSVEVVAGTPTTGAASDPELGGGSILNGDAEAYVAIARVPIVGLAPSEPVVLVGGLKSNSQLAESISAIEDSVSLIDGWSVYGLNGVKVAIKAVSATVSIDWLYIDSIYGGDMQSAKLPDGVFSAAPACSASIAQASATCWIAPTTNSIPTKTETQRFRVLSSSKETITLRVMITAVGA